MAKLHRDNAGYIGCSHEETQDPYYSYNKLSLPLSGATESFQRPAEVTHTVTVAGGKFVIGGVSQATLSLIEGGTYKFDQSDSSNGTHPFKFSQTSNGTWNRGTEYTKGVTYVGTPGSSGAYTQLVVPFGGLDLYYYCGNHTGMGGSASTPANAGMFTAALPILKTTDQFGASAPTGGSAVLVEGDPSSSTSNPFGSGNGYSIQFDGNDRLKILGGTIVGDFTYECWFNMDSGTSGYRRILSTNEPLYSSEQTMIRLHTNGNIQFYAGNGTPEQQGGTGSTSTWYHAAIVRSGDTISYYIDGSRQGTDTYSASNDIPLTQVCLAWGYGSEYFTGKISNVRVSNNARYTGVSHTVPTSTFSSDSNTLLLAAHTNSLTTVQGTWASPASGWPGTEDTAPDPYAANLVLALPMNGSNNGTTFTDQSAAIKGSGSAKAITRNNAVTSTAQSIYYGSSGYFDGSEDSLSTPNSSDFDFGTGDFTIEQWVYQTEQTSSQYYVINAKYTSSTHSWWWAILGNYSRFFFYSSTLSSNFGTSSTTVPLNTWTHLAVTRKNGILRMLQDGVVTHEMVWPDNMTSTSHAVTIGEDADGNYDFKGYISDTRIYKGVAKYQPEGSGSLGMDVVTYKGNSTSQVINTLAFEPDFIWCKTLTNAVDHKLTDSVRGFTKVLESNQNRAEATDTNGITGTSTGFNVGSSNDFNNGSRSYIAWCWKAGGAATTIATNSLTNTAYERSQNWTNLMTFNAGTWNGNGINPFNLDGSDHDYGNVTRSNGGYATLDISSLTGSRVISVTSQQTEVTITHDGGTTTFTPPHTSQITHTFDAVTNPTSIKFIGLNSGSYFVLVGVSVDGKRLINSNISAPTVPSIASTVSANADYGFSIVKYNSGTTTGNYTLAHSLSSVPKFIIHKQLSTGNWWVYHESVINDLKKYLQLNSTGSVQTNSGAFWGNAFPDSSTFGIGVGDLIGTSTDAVAYCWSEIPGFSKISSYSGTGLGGNKVTTGFKPKFVLIKASSSGTSAGWGLYQEGVTDRQLMANCSGEEGVRGDCATGSSLRDIQSNVTFNEDGFTLSSGWYEQNNSGTTYIYAAFAESAPGDPGQDAFKILETLNTKDQSSSAHIVTNNGASFQTGVKKFYDGAAATNSGYKVIQVTSDDFNVGTKDFTIEFWAYSTDSSTDTAARRFISTGTNNVNAIQIGHLDSTTGRISYSGDMGGHAYGPDVDIRNRWVHVAAVREAGVVSLYVDGQRGTTLTDANAKTQTTLWVSGYNTTIGAMAGYIQDIKFYANIAKYTSSFSPPERSIQGTARRYPSGVYVVS